MQEASKNWFFRQTLLTKGYPQFAPFVAKLIELMGKAKLSLALNSSDSKNQISLIWCKEDDESQQFSTIILPREQSYVIYNTVHNDDHPHLWSDINNPPEQLLKDIQTLL
jgi:hypothetical protein